MLEELVELLEKRKCAGFEKLKAIWHAEYRDRSVPEALVGGHVQGLKSG